MSSQNNDRKKFACPYFWMGACKFGANCRQSHDRSAPFDEVCRYYQNGYCAYGKNCRYIHKKLNKEPKTPQQDPTLLLPTVGPVTRIVNPEPRRFKDGSSMAERISKMSTSAPKPVIIRPLCPYLIKSGRCEDVKCEFVHGIICKFCGSHLLHPDDPSQRQRHIDQCTIEQKRLRKEDCLMRMSETKLCGICLDSVLETDCRRFGILENCDHVYCLDCIRKWRAANNSFDNRIVKACPECRKTSDYVIPSDTWYEDLEDKNRIIEDYRKRIALIDCTYFRKGEGDCPFGDRCFYKHTYPDGTVAKLGEPEARKLLDADGNIVRPFRLTIGSLLEPRTYPDSNDDLDAITEGSIFDNFNIR